MDGQPWCAMFLSWCAAQAGAGSIIPKHAYTPAGVSWFRQRGQYGSRPRVGALVYFYTPSLRRVGHVGLVEAVHEDGSITTIEGNSNLSGSRQGTSVVRLRRRARIDGFGYPRYDSAPPRRQPPRRSEERVAKGVVYWSRLRYGQHNSDSVRHLQRELNAAVNAGLPVTGNYLDKTRAAVAAYQRSQGWSGQDADGHIFPGGRETTKRLLGRRGYRVVW